MIGSFRIYDTHTHLGRAAHSGREQTDSDLLRSMDDAGVDRSLLIPFPVVDDHRDAHNRIAQAVKAHPDRFSGAACLHPFLPRDFFLDELKRCATELGFRALKLQPQYHGLNPVSHRNDFYFEAAVQHNLPIVCHTGSGAPFALPSLFIAPARRFPELRIILGHAGGSVYFLETIVAASVCENVWIDFSSLMPHHMLEVLAHVPSHRLMAGSDLPESCRTEMSKVLTLSIPDADKANILWNTPRSLFDGDGA